MRNRTENLLPHDIIVEILLWLPLESLPQVRRVCKLWCSTISDSKFIAKYQTHFGDYSSRSNYGLIAIFKHPFNPINFRLCPDNNPYTCSNDLEMNLKNFRIHGNQARYKISGSCNGLICSPYTPMDYGIGIYLCNPCIRFSTIIEPHRFKNFSPCDLYYGIGFHKPSNDYKVIKFRRSGSPGEAAVYSVNTRSWKSIEVPILRKLVHGLSVFLKGFIHWFSFKAIGYSPKYTEKIVMIFDVCNEVFGEMKLPEIGPDIDWGSPKSVAISVVKGSLSVLVGDEDGYGNDDRIHCCHVWTMKEYGVTESWIKEFTVVHKQGIARSLEFTVGGKILCSYTDPFRYNHQPFELVLYDPEKKEYKNVGQASNCDQIISFVGSLEFLDRIC